MKFTADRKRDRIAGRLVATATGLERTPVEADSCYNERAVNCTLIIHSENSLKTPSEQSYKLINALDLAKENRTEIIHPQCGHITICLRQCKLWIIMSLSHCFNVDRAVIKGKASGSDLYVCLLLVQGPLDPCSLTNTPVSSRPHLLSGVES